jgi:hypothetical protein
MSYITDREVKEGEEVWGKEGANDKKHTRQN